MACVKRFRVAIAQLYAALWFQAKKVLKNYHFLLGMLLIISLVLTDKLRN